MQVQSRVAMAKAYYEKNEARLDATFFVGGFLFDIVTADQIDSWSTIGQQVFYLLAITFTLTQMFVESSSPPDSAPIQVSPWIEKWRKYRVPIIHFFFGSLLNMYAIFFFKSSSLLVSFAFMGVIVALTVANELSRFKSLGLPFKFGLLSLCYLSFFSFVVPIWVGAISVLIFLFSMVVGCLPLAGLAWWIQTYRPPLFDRAKSQILTPMATVLLVFLSLYMLRLIPPVPLSIPFIGVYHKIEKVDGEYRLYNERPWWKFWHNGDQDFLAQKDDKIYVAFRIFSPARFSDQVLVRWYWRDQRLGWVEQDSIPIKIVGGREEGFRGYGVKSNYQPGQWRVQVETKDKREIGRIGFELEIEPTNSERQLKFETM